MAQAPRPPAPASGTPSYTAAPVPAVSPGNAPGNNSPTTGLSPSLRARLDLIKILESINDLDDVLSEAGTLLTAQGAPLERPAEQREIMALFESGLMIVSRSHMTDPYVLKLESYARLRGLRVERKLPATLEVVRESYIRTGGKSDRVASQTQMQRDILRLIIDAVNENASDIHIVVEQNRAIVEMRMNGVLRQRLEWRAEYGLDFCAACFAMADASDANYNPNEYQAARISRGTVDLPDVVQALRLQFNPLAYGGRYLIMRLLYRGSGKQEETGAVERLGYHPAQYGLIKRMIATPVGIGIVSGPTGSGKSTTLFHVLSTVMAETRHERNVITIEDPPERPIAGAKQMPVTNAQSPEERSRKFIQAIAASMRSDPDTIMIGEIRDRESAKLAIEASMTGHQVWTTLHANDALMIVNRLRDIGVQEYNLFTPGMIFGLMGQRLARALCTKCRIPLREAITQNRIDGDTVARVEAVSSVEELDNMFIAGPGCAACGNGKGYAGRTVVAEVIYPDETLMAILREDKRTEARRYWLEELKGLSLMNHCIDKMKNGVLSPYEVERVVGPIELEIPGTETKRI